MSLFTTRKIILASASPRRLMLLRQIGVEPQVVCMETEELKQLGPGMQAAELVMYNAQRKGAAVQQLVGRQDALIVSADTVVICHGTLFGKPADEEEAAQMLRQLSGNTHSVFTGQCVIDAKTGRHACGYSETQVRFVPLCEEDVAAYIASGDPMDKAGAYGMQSLGGLFVEAISGDYGTVVGLSLPLLRSLVQKLESH